MLAISPDRSDGCDDRSPVQEKLMSINTIETQEPTEVQVLHPKRKAHQRPEPGVMRAQSQNMKASRASTLQLVTRQSPK
jgi:hypothetical protein